jgi:hypothetical protein
MGFEYPLAPPGRRHKEPLAGRFDRGITENGVEMFHGEEFEGTARMLHMHQLADINGAQNGTQQHNGVGLGSQHQHPVLRKF